MHAGQLTTDTALVRRLVAEQFPQWSGLPVTRFASGGTVNAIYRLGESMSVRLPLLPGDESAIDMLTALLAGLAGRLPVALPAVLAEGRPGHGFPLRWSVHDWLPGVNPVAGSRDADGLAADLAAFVAALRRLDAGGVRAARRGGSLAAQDTDTRDAIARLSGVIDTGAATAAWQEALAVPDWAGPSVRFHGDLMPGNLLTTGGHLTAVIDWETAGAGDPACDLIPAWNLLTATSRRAFRAGVGAGDAEWARGRGRALSMALIQLPYYAVTNPAMAANARYVIGEVLADVAERAGR